MAKPASIKIRLNSTADTGSFCVTKKNARTMTEKMVVKKYDPGVRKHVEFKEGKIKEGFRPAGVRSARSVMTGRFSSHHSLSLRRDGSACRRTAPEAGCP